MQIYKDIYIYIYRERERYFLPHGILRTATMSFIQHRFSFLVLAFLLLFGHGYLAKKDNKPAGPSPKNPSSPPAKDPPPPPPGENSPSSPNGKGNGGGGSVAPKDPPPPPKENSPSSPNGKEINNNTDGKKPSTPLSPPLSPPKPSPSPKKPPSTPKPTKKAKNGKRIASKSFVLCKEPGNSKLVEVPVGKEKPAQAIIAFEKIKAKGKAKYEFCQKDFSAAYASEDYVLCRS
jgi:hypothetical protein